MAPIELIPVPPYATLMVDDPEMAPLIACRGPVMEPTIAVVNRPNDEKRFVEVAFVVVPSLTDSAVMVDDALTIIPFEVVGAR